MFTAAAALLFGATAVSAQGGVFATGPMGVTNPLTPALGTPINQSSDARLLSLNSIDDFCIYGPPTVEPIGNSEAYEVAWCTKARNNARIIPDGTFTALSFLKTDFYIQIMGFGDLTKINIPAGDSGGELDPHGAEGLGNPIGGNITVNIDGVDKNIEEWMMFVAVDQFCFRACTSANSTYSAAQMCEHKLDVMGCQFVMPGNYNFKDTNTFESCDADVAYPPGWYPTVAGATTSFSKFEQYWTGVVGTQTFTVGDTVTPQAAFSIPSSSNCKTTTTVGNGIPLSLLASGATGPAPTNAAATQPGATVQATVSNTATATGSNKPTGTSKSGSGSGSGSGGSSGSSNSGSNSGSNGATALVSQGMTLVTLVVAIAGVALIQ